MGAAYGTAKSGGSEELVLDLHGCFLSLMDRPALALVPIDAFGLIERLGTFCTSRCGRRLTALCI